MSNDNINTLGHFFFKLGFPDIENIPQKIHHCVLVRYKAVHDDCVELPDVDSNIGGSSPGDDSKFTCTETNKNIKKPII